jgi:hypothetical protein
MKLAKIKFYLKRLYRLSLSHKKHESLVWEDLKKLHSNNNWKFGVYEKDKCIETIFQIGEEHKETFYYMVYSDCFHCRVKILDVIPPNLTTDLFVLASHFNNLLNNGVVVVNVNEQFVEYHQKKELILHLLYKGEMYEQLISHYYTSKDIYNAFQRLVIEKEAPVIIIADYLKEVSEKAEKKIS